MFDDFAKVIPYAYSNAYFFLWTFLLISIIVVLIHNLIIVVFCWYDYHHHHHHRRRRLRHHAVSQQRVDTTKQPFWFMLSQRSRYFVTFSTTWFVWCQWHSVSAGAEERNLPSLFTDWRTRCMDPTIPTNAAGDALFNKFI